MTYGVTPQGFNGKPLSACLAELEADLRDAFGAGINLAPQSPFAKIAGIVADREASLWELAEAVSSAFTTDGAAGVSLDLLMALTGARRLRATRSVAIAIAAGDAATVLSVGRVVSVAGTGARFATLAEATLEAADAWAGSTEYAAGDVVTNDGNVYLCTVAGESASSGGPTGDGDAISDGTATWRFVGEGDGYAEVALAAEDTGPVAAPAHTLTTIETPVSGWSGVVNALDAELGRDEETDAEARLRREELLGVSGTSVVDAIAARVRAVADVEAVRVFENPGDTADGDGLPPHSVEALVLGGGSDAIAQAIWTTKPGGIKAHGSTSGTATDAEGRAHTVAFTRPVEIPVYVAVTLTKGADYPDDGDARVKAAIVAYGVARGIGADVVASQHLARVFSVPGVEDVTELFIGTSPAPDSSATIPVSDRQIAVFDTSRVTVSSS